MQSGISNYFTLIVAFLCNRTSKSDPVNRFLASSHSLEHGQVFECNWGFWQAGWLGNCQCFPEGQLLTYWKHVSLPFPYENCSQCLGLGKARLCVKSVEMTVCYPDLAHTANFAHASTWMFCPNAQFIHKPIQEELYFKAWVLVSLWCFVHLWDCSHLLCLRSTPFAAMWTFTERQFESHVLLLSVNQKRKF